MIATDTSSLLSYIAGDESLDVETLDEAMAQESLVLPPVVLAEALSDPHILPHTEHFIGKIKTLNITMGFWQRAGKTRSILLRKGLKAKLADTFIAQSCIDHDVALITRDKDFRHYARHCGLKLYDA